MWLHSDIRDEKIESNHMSQGKTNVFTWPNSLYSKEWQQDNVSDLQLGENMAYKLLIQLSFGEHSFL